MALLAFIFLFSFLRSSGTEAAQLYDYFQLVQQHPITLCMFDTSCVPGATLPHTFTIHGLWPSNFSTPHRLCEGTLFDPKKMQNNPVLVNELLQSWPSYTSKSSMDFWADEYDKHGTCSENDYPQTLYFNLAHNIWGRYQAFFMLSRHNILPGISYPVVDIIKAVTSEIGGAIPSIMCKEDSTGDFILHEIIVCLNKKLSAFVNCVRPSTCRGTMATYP